MTEYQALDGRIANHLINGMALSYRRLANGSMIVIAPNGMKLIFGPEKVKVAEAQLQSADLPRRSGKGRRSLTSPSPFGSAKTAPQIKNRFGEGGRVNRRKEMTMTDYSTLKIPRAAAAG